MLLSEMASMRPLNAASPSVQRGPASSGALSRPFYGRRSGPVEITTVECPAETERRGLGQTLSSLPQAAVNRSATAVSD